MQKLLKNLLRKFFSPNMRVINSHAEIYRQKMLRMLQKAEKSVSGIEHNGYVLSDN